MIKIHFKRLIIILIAICLNNTAHAKIITVESMKNVQQQINEVLASIKPQNLFVAFDMDMTLTQPIQAEMYYPTIKKYSAIYKKILGSVPVEQQDMMLALIVQYPQQLVENYTPKVVDALQSTGVKTIAFTNSPTGKIRTNDGITKSIAQIRYEYLNKLGINFSKSFDADKVAFNKLPMHRGNYPELYKGILLANGEKGPDAGKGKVLIAFLERFDIKPETIIMVDDRLKNLQDIETALQKYDPKITFIGMEYEAAKNYKIPNVSEHEFTKFWENLAVQAADQPM